MKRKFCWLYYDTLTDQIVQVRRPRRRMIEPMMQVYVFNEDGDFQDIFSMKCSDFHKRFLYVGGLNTGKNKYKVVFKRRGFMVRTYRGFTNKKKADAHLKQLLKDFPFGDLGSKSIGTAVRA